MEVMEGYKMTEVGVIPVDWETTKLSQLCTRLNVGFVGVCEPYYTTESKGVLLLRTGNLKGDTLELSKTKHVTKEFHNKNKKSQVSSNNIIISRHGNSGNAVLIPESIKDANTLNIVIIKTNSRRLNEKFAVAAINSYNVRKQTETKTAGSTQGVINTKEIAQLILPVPILSEQKAIAVTLGDMIDLIKSFNHLISKKRAIKQGAMQQLLTPPSEGGKRLAGFSGEWKEKELGDLILSLDAGVSVNSVDANDKESHDFHILKTSSVFNGKFYTKEGKKIISKDIKRAKLNPKKNSIIFSRMNTPEMVGECAFIKDNYPNLFLPDRLWQTTFKKNIKINAQWLNYLLNTTTYKAKIKDGATGTSGSMKNISKKSLLSIKVIIPKIEEQTAIAKILSDMDNEIESLENQRAKYQKLKEGMMQELLTGKIRLV